MVVQSLAPADSVLLGHLAPLLRATAEFGTASGLFTNRADRDMLGTLDKRGIGFLYQDRS